MILVLQMYVKESNNIELKEKISESLLKAIVAFLNSEDGIIYIGIKDDGTVVGIPEGEVDLSLRRISDLLTDAISPACIDYARIRLETMEGKSVIRIDVKKGKKLYYIRKYGLSEAGCFVRIGSTCKSLTHVQIMERYEKSLGVKEQSICEMPSRKKNLTFQHLKNYLTSHNIHINESRFAENFNLLTSDGKYNYMAEILADENDISINVAIFSSIDKSEYLRRETFGGRCLLLAMEQAMSHVLSFNRTYVKFDGVRVDRKMFDEAAFIQAWINACVHNKWSESDHPGIYIYADRLEIESFGGIPKALTEEEFLSGKSAPVNPELFEIFSKCGFAERSGYGVPTVVKAYGSRAFVFSPNFIDVVIPFDLQGFRKDKEKGDGYMPKKIHPKELKRQILSFLKDEPYLSRKDLVDLLGCGDGTVRHYIECLKKEKSIVRIGGDRGGYWEVLSVA